MRFRVERRGQCQVDTAEDLAAEDREKKPKIFDKFLSGLTYTQMDSKIDFWLRWTSVSSKPPASRNLIQVVLLRRPLRCFKYTLPALPNSQFLNPFVYNASRNYTEVETCNPS